MLPIAVILLLTIFFAWHNKHNHFSLPSFNGWHIFSVICHWLILCWKRKKRQFAVLSRFSWIRSEWKVWNLSKCFISHVIIFIEKLAHSMNIACRSELLVSDVSTEIEYRCFFICKKRTLGFQSTIVNIILLHQIDWYCERFSFFLINFVFYYYFRQRESGREKGRERSVHTFHRPHSFLILFRLWPLSIFKMENLL